jgi:hypothetical protein
LHYVVDDRDPEVLDVQDANGFYPIHHLAQGITVSVLKKFMKYNPERVVDYLLHYDVTPDEHLKIRNEVLDSLVNQCPHAVEIPDKKGDPALRLA